MNNTPESLTRLAQSMESLRPMGAQPAWAEISGPLERPSGVRWRPDLDTMVGFGAPPSCAAIAAVGYGWAHGLADGPPGAREILAPGEHRRVRIVCLMTRQGDLAGYLRDGTTILVREPPTLGRVLDCIRRCFQLPTPPPEQPSDLLLANMWLANVVGATERATKPLTWPAIAYLHPVLEVAAAEGVDVPAPQFRRIMHVGAEVWSWSFLLAQATSPGWLADLLPAGAGGWMDEGIFSRWVLDSMRRADDILDQITPLIEPAAAKRLRTTLKQLGVLGVTPRPRAQGCTAS